MMGRAYGGSSAEEAEQYLSSVFATCTGFELAVVTTADAAWRRHLRERLIAAGADLVVVPPTVEALLLGVPTVGADVRGHRTYVRWIEADDELEDENVRWQDLAVALNRSRERLRDEHRYLWVLAGPLSLRRIMARHAQDIYSGAYKVPHVLAHAGAELTWLHLSDLQLGRSVVDVPRQGGDVWRSLERLLLPDLVRTLDQQGMAPDLVLISGDLAASGHPDDYAEVDRFLDRIVEQLERRVGRPPMLLAVPGNHDVARPTDPVERDRLERLRHHDDQTPEARALREHLWERRDARLIERLFVGYLQWARRRVFAPLCPDELGMEAGVVYLRSVTMSHMPGDFSVVIEKDDLRLGIVGLNSAWTSYDDELCPGGVVLPPEQIEAAMGDVGPRGWADDVHETILLTHHGPEWLSEPSLAALSRRIQPIVRFAAHLCGPGHAQGEPRVEAPALPTPQRGHPVFAWGMAPRGAPSGYRLGRITVEGRIGAHVRVLAPIPARGAWRYVDGMGREPGTAASSTVEQEPSWWIRALSQYLERLVSLHGALSYVGFETAVRVALPLDELHVPLDAMVDLREVRRTFESADEAEDVHEALDVRGHRITLRDAFPTAALLGRRGLVLLGDPGAGKTTRLQQVLLQVALHGPESMGLPEGTVPVFLSLREASSLDTGLFDMIHRELNALPLGLSDPFIERSIERGRLLLLLDGLDEVIEPSDRGRLARWITDAHRALPHAYFLVTSRYAGYTKDARLGPDFLELHLRPLSAGQVEAFVRRWYALVERATTADEAQAELEASRHAEELLAVLRRPGWLASRLYGMIHNPLLLAAICLVHRDRGRLPRNRVVLYDELVSVLLERWRQTTTKELPVRGPDVRTVLQTVAWWMHQQLGRSRAAIAELRAPVAEGLARTGHGEISAEQFLQAVRDESGVLTGWGRDDLGFVHLGIQEFLAAREARRRGLDEPEILEDLARRFDEPWWQEVTLLMLGLDEPSVFDRYMHHVTMRAPFIEWAKSTMMDLCVTEAARSSPQPFVDLVSRGGGEPATLVERQLAALDLLARAFPAALEGLRAVLETHSSERVRKWWERRNA